MQRFPNLCCNFLATNTKAIKGVAHKVYFHYLVSNGTSQFVGFIGMLSACLINFRALLKQQVYRVIGKTRDVSLEVPTRSTASN